MSKAGMSKAGLYKAGLNKVGLANVGLDMYTVNQRHLRNVAALLLSN